jgi:NTP pyrophosphatase (non-canonical NTP hydrolase)
MIDFNQYQDKVRGFMNPEVLESQEDTFMNAILGLCGEAGEVADAVKKARYHKGELNLERLDKEVGDVLFYCGLYAIARGRLLSDIAQMNVDKLTQRYEDKPWSPEASKAKRDENVEPTSGVVTSKEFNITSVTQSANPDN